MRISLGVWALVISAFAISVQAWAQTPAAQDALSTPPAQTTTPADATIGTRIKSTHCFTETEFDIYLIQLKAARDDMQRQGCYPIAKTT
jgi:hypothetical protein